MDIFNKVAKKFGLIDDEKSSTEKIMDERNKIKLNLAVKLCTIGFSDDEVAEVLGVIDSAEEDIKAIKDSLIGTNINPKGDPMQPLSNGVDKIRARQLQMQQEIQETINRISEKYRK